MAKSRADVPRGSPSTLDAALDLLADALLERIPRSIEDGLVVMRQEVPEYFVADDDPAFVDLYTRSYDANLRAIWRGLRDGFDQPLAEPPAFGLGEATGAAEIGISLEALLQTIRIAHRLMLEDAMEEAERLIDDEALRSAAIRHTHRWLFDYIDWLTPFITETYQRERDAQFRGRERRRRQLVRRLLRGDAVDERQLGYRLEHEHLGVVAWGAHAEQALSVLADASGSAALTTAGSDSAAWGWLGSETIELPSLDALRSLLPADARLALGAPARSIDGFRQTHRQALEAYRVAKLRDDQVTRFEDVELVALATRDLDLAREFVARQLGPLTADDDRGRVLLETLRAYFDAGGNAAAAGARLNVNDRTIAYRIRSLEERIGAPILGRHAELALALRLLDVVGRSPSP